MKHAVVVLLFVLFSAGLLSQSSNGTTYNFLKLPTSTRSAGMGGSFISVKDNDLSLVPDNPAMLDSNMHNMATSSYVNYIKDVNFGYIGYARHFDKVGTFSLGMQFLGYGKFISADEAGNTSGNFSAGDYSLDISYGHPFDSVFSIGASMKFIYSNYDYLNSFGMALDLGGMYVSKNKLVSLGLVLSNIGYQIVPYNNVRERLPFIIQFAGSFKLAKAPLRITILANNLQTWDLVGKKPVEGLPAITPEGNILTASDGGSTTVDNIFRHLVFGLELVPSDKFFIQFAYNHLRKKELGVQGTTPLSGFSFGVGMRIKKIKFSYALASYSARGVSNHFTVTVDFKQFKKRSSN